MTGLASTRLERFLETGIRLKEEMASLYRLLGEKARSNNTRRIFSILIEEEEEHLGELERLAEVLRKLGPAELPEPVEVELDYSALVFKERSGTVGTNGVDSSKAVQLALESEKIFLLYLYDLQARMLPLDAPGAVESIGRMIEKEKSHINRIAALVNTFGTRETAESCPHYPPPFVK